ncbi:hypothetical protein BDIM_30190 [Brevundimonas diminuta ATCC 11568]|nr:hypothetical protein BDIM_30190 [Brevundimonas diminuta ATCC 11568]
MSLSRKVHGEGRFGDGTGDASGLGAAAIHPPKIIKKGISR